MDEHIDREELIRARDAALAVVADMSEESLKVPTYQTILEQLVRRALSKENRSKAELSDHGPSLASGTKAIGTTNRLLHLIEEGLFSEPRSLKEIRERLAESGFHYRLEDLGTPLTRLVQRKRLRRSQFVVRGKKVWKYSNH